MRIRADGVQEDCSTGDRWPDPPPAWSLGDQSSQEVPGGLDRKTIPRVVQIGVSVGRIKLVLN